MNYNHPKIVCHLVYSWMCLLYLNGVCFSCAKLIALVCAYEIQGKWSIVEFWYIQVKQHIYLQEESAVN